MFENFEDNDIYNDNDDNENFKELYNEDNLMKDFPSVCELDATEMLARKYEMREQDTYKCLGIFETKEYFGIDSTTDKATNTNIHKEIPEVKKDLKYKEEVLEDSCFKISEWDEQ